MLSKCIHIHLLDALFIFQEMMVRNYMCKSDRGTYPKEALTAAARDHANWMSIRRAAAENQVPYQTLAHYVPIFQTHDDIESISIGKIDKCCQQQLRTI